MNLISSNQTSPPTRLTDLPTEVLLKIGNSCLEDQCNLYHSTIKYRCLLNLSSSSRKLRYVLSPLIWNNATIIEEKTSLRIIFGVRGRDMEKWTAGDSPLEYIMCVSILLFCFFCFYLYINNAALSILFQDENINFYLHFFIFLVSHHLEKSFQYLFFNGSLTY